MARSPAPAGPDRLVRWRCAQEARRQRRREDTEIGDGKMSSGTRRLAPSSGALHISSFFGPAADEFAISVAPTPAPVCWTLPSRRDTSAGLSNTHLPVVLSARIFRSFASLW